MSSRYTSIQISPEIRAKLAKLKTKRETYNDVIEKLLQLIPEGDDEGKYTEEFRIGLLNAELDIIHGRTISHAELKRKLGVK